MKGIETEVKEAIAISNKELLNSTYTIPFPSGSETNRKNCINDLTAILDKDLAEVAKSNGA